MKKIYLGSCFLIPGPFKKVPVALSFLALAALSGFAQPNNTILLETWTGVTGTAVSNLTSNTNYPNTPRLDSGKLSVC